MQQRAQSLEASATQETDATKRHDVDEVLKMMKLEGEQTEKSTQQLQARESELAGQLQSEQLRLTELNDRLDQMERTLNVP